MFFILSNIPFNVPVYQQYCHGCFLPKSFYHFFFYQNQIMVPKSKFGKKIVVKSFW